MKIKNLIKSFTIVFILFLGCSLFAQKEGNIWYFGQNAGIDFNGATPLALTNGALYTNEGCATICDTSGSLLFYTDGNKVWNKNHTLMPNGNGLMGHFSSTQSAIIVKKPSSTTIYYVFTVYQLAGAPGLRYSEVDISLQNGLGDVNTNKNILIVTPTCEKITAVSHKNNVDFWIITHLFGSNTFHSYLLSSTGLTMTPVVSNVGAVVSSNIVYSIGYLKASPNGNQIAAARWQMNSVELFDFNKQTGSLSNPISFGNYSNGSPYGVEFSPNSTLLYVAECNSSSDNIFQYNLLAGSANAIINSRISIASLSKMGGALQLAPDQKIYQSLCLGDTLGVINNPDVLGIGCNYNSNGLFLAGKLSVFGLPTFFNSIFSPPMFSSNYYCYGDSTIFNFSLNSVDSVLWDFGDVNSGINNSSKKINPSHLFTDTGSFVVSVIYYTGSFQDTLINTILIKPIPEINLGNDTSLCDGKTLLLNATNPNASYLWHNNSTDSVFIVAQQGTYWVKVDLNQCIASDTINVYYNPFPVIELGNDTSICPGDTLTLKPGISNSNFKWQDNSTDSVFVLSHQGIYWVEVTKNNCSATDTIIVHNYALPSINLGRDTSICQGKSISIIANAQNVTYLWNDNSTNPEFKVIYPGTYWVIVSDSNCSSSDTINIEFTDCEIILEMPNVFTPNGDGNNDYFLPKEIKNISQASIVIFNRWGRQLYESNNIMDGWNGKFEGNNCTDGTYYWIVKYIDINGKQDSMNGFLSLLRY